ncbi:MAG: hypothetical protein QNJ34_20925 [Xenococcaceae cyanobacterium MO_188.B29]|nr:hypothetical protein [Xenococcaceae cyanobacterium MO_188.B29]
MTAERCNKDSNTLILRQCNIEVMGGELEIKAQFGDRQIKITIFNFCQD